jgi:uncharacterized protein YprB with RNaseH-like and TPR domain
MTSIVDKLSHVSALRPAAGAHRQASVASKNSISEELRALVEGEICSNRFGCHLRVQRHFAQPVCGNAAFRAMQLIASGPTEMLCDPDQWLFLDTETTGLSGGTGTYAFLVGLGWWEADGFVVEQYFMRDHSEERSLLLAVSELLAHRRVLVTFNGKSFDWPLLQTRYQMTKVGRIPEPLAHLDLLHPARRLWRLHLASVALKELERHILHFDRGQDIPSAAIPQRYFDFLRGGPPAPIAEILYHNQMDLCGLATLALHISRLLENPESNSCRAGELFGISRLLQERGEEELAIRIYRKSIDEGLPRDAEQIAQRELARMAKRERKFELSNALWEKLLGSTMEGLKAYEQLAIHYEHWDLQPQKAATLSREALIKLQEAFQAGRLSGHRYRKWHASFQHRLARLEIKIGKSSD